MCFYLGTLERYCVDMLTVVTILLAALNSRLDVETVTTLFLQQLLTLS